MLFLYEKKKKICSLTVSLKMYEFAEVTFKKQYKLILTRYFRIYKKQ